MKGCAWVVVGVIIGAVLVVGMMGWMLLVPWHVPPQELSPVPGEPAITVTVSESYLNRRLALELAERNMTGLAQATVDVQLEGVLTIVVEGKIGLGPLELFPKGTVVTQLNSGGDGPTLSIVRLEVAGLPIPKGLLPEPAKQVVDVVEAEVNAAIGSTMQRQGLRIARTETTGWAITAYLVME
ncbi:MAG: hypothetical protein ISS50_01225 [Anaerolineae bacterium]|nr:hypothetical protein [Anaerolineae bacterium]